MTIPISRRLEKRVRTIEFRIVEDPIESCISYFIDIVVLVREKSSSSLLRIIEFKRAIECEGAIELKS